MKKLFGTRGRDILRNIQKAIVSSSANIARTLSRSLELDNGVVTY